MEFSKAQKYRARVSDTYYLNEGKSYLLVKLELVEPDEIVFQAGQYVSIKVNVAGERRSYSIVSTPDINHGVTLVAEILPNGKGSEYLRGLKPGDEVEILGPLGRFVVDEVTPKLLFVATGSGIAPIYGMIEDRLINKRDMRPMRLHWGMRDESKIFWLDNFQRLSDEHPYFVFDLVLSQPGPEWSLCSGHVQDCLVRDLEKVNIKEWAGHICGNPKMVEQVSELLAKMGMPESQIHHEKFI